MSDALLGIASATNHTLSQWTPSAWAARNITSAVKEPVALPAMTLPGVSLVGEMWMAGRIRIRWALIPRRVAESMAFEGEPVELEWLEKLHQVEIPPGLSKPVVES